MEGSVEFEKEVNRISTEATQIVIDLSESNDNASVVDLVVDNSSEKEVIVVLETENVFKAFNNMLNPEMVLHTNLEPSIPVSRGIKRKRPANWQTIAEYYMVYRSVRGTIKFFELSYLNESIPYWTTTFGRWMKDYQANKSHLQYGREPDYGTEIDEKLANIVRDYNKNAVLLTDMILRLQLIALLTTFERQDILDRIAPNDSEVSKERDLRFAKRWAHRLYKRHKFPSRVATTKMRDELPADYETKKDKYTLLLSKTIHENQVPDALICAMDETNTQFTPQVKRTRCASGTRQVRLIGIGHEKPQITVSPTVTATGDTIKPTQLIFGGKTKRCHPNQGRVVQPPGLYYDQTQSHW